MSPDSIGTTTSKVERSRNPNGRPPGGCKTPEYRLWNRWRMMVSRCHTRPHKDYGLRGIFVCQRWRESFAAFAQDMGHPPAPKLSLERVKNDRGYDCGNCDDCRSRGAEPNVRWATAKEQSRNTRANVFLTHDGLTLCVAEWAERTGYSISTLHRRIGWGWTPAQILTTPPGEGDIIGKPKKPAAQRVLVQVGTWKWRWKVVRDVN